MMAVALVGICRAAGVGAHCRVERRGGSRWPLIPVAVLLASVSAFSSCLERPARSCGSCSFRGDGWWCSRRRWQSSLPSAVWVTRSRLARSLSSQSAAVFFVWSQRAFSSLVVLPGLRLEDSVRGMLERLPELARALRAPTNMRPPARTTRWSPPACPSRALYVESQGRAWQARSRTLTPEWIPTREPATQTYAEPGTPEHAAASTCALQRDHISRRIPGSAASHLSCLASAGERAALSIALPERDDGLMAVPVPQGPVELTVDWTTTRDVLIGALAQRRWRWRSLQVCLSSNES